jgi:hypothetical protein
MRREREGIGRVVWMVWWEWRTKRISLMYIRLVWSVVFVLFA